jgi:SAM-dependent methyltransferase
MDRPVVPDYWNHNVHYQPLILAAVPAGCGAALDVGCGDGLLVRRLAPLCRQVTGIDPDAAMIRLARQRSRDYPHVGYVEQDFRNEPYRPGSFDFICSVTAVHHMNFSAALTRMRELARPGGCVAVVGLARDASPADLARGVVAAPVNRVLRMIHGESSPGAPIAAPDMSWDQVRAAARDLLPGVSYRRHLLWRYSLVWRKPVL